MSYSIERLEDHPVLLITYNADFQVPEELEQQLHDANTYLDRESDPITVILDTGDYTSTVQDLMTSTRYLMTADNQIPNHPMTAKTILVTDMRMLKMGMDGMHRMGIVQNIDLVTALEEAFNRVHTAAG
jgi:hypothetical protein